MCGEMAMNKPAENDAHLPFAALQLLAPPVRLVSSALWKVMKQRDVMQYGTVEEFVTSACETVPGLLTVRHQGRLSVGLRARLVLELCCTQPDVTVIQPHLDRVLPPAVLSASSTQTVASKRGVKIVKAVNNFHALVRTLLKDPSERERFFKEEFPVDYGPRYDQELEKLLWEFLLRLDQLLPVPTLAQTVSWMGSSPPVLEECARASTQPQLLKILLDHQACLGHLEPAASLPPNMGDSILNTLSLPLSGKVPSNQTKEDRRSPDIPSTKKNPVAEASNTQTREMTQFITPVIGLISNKDVPIMVSASKKLVRSDRATSSKVSEVPWGTSALTKEKQNQDAPTPGPREGNKTMETEQRDAPRRSGGTKRRPPEQRESQSEEEEVLPVSRPSKQQMIRGNLVCQERERETNQCDGKGAKAAANQEAAQAAIDIKAASPVRDPALLSLMASCLQNQPQVIVNRLELGDTISTKFSYAQSQRLRSKSLADSPDSNMQSNQRGMPEVDFPSMDNKENRPMLVERGSPAQRNTEPTGEDEDFVADSEDEATKNFRGRLFSRRYYKTKHGTYVPTLREFWKPARTSRR